MRGEKDDELLRETLRREPEGVLSCRALGRLLHLLWARFLAV